MTRSSVRAAVAAIETKLPRGLAEGRRDPSEARRYLGPSIYVQPAAATENQRRISMPQPHGAPKMSKNGDTVNVI